MERDGLLPVIEELNRFKIEVVQSTLDALKIRAMDAQLAVKQKGGSLEAHGDKVGLVQPTAADRKANAKRWESLETWVRNYTSVIATEAVIDASDDRISEILSSSSIDTIATAAANNKALLSEDRRFRALAHSMGVTSSSWTQPLLLAILNAGKITREKYVQLLVNLQKHRIGFVSIGLDDLLTAANSTLQDDFDTMVDALTAPNVHHRSAVIIGVEFVKELWLNTRYVKTRDGLVSKFLHSLITRRPDGLNVFREIVILTSGGIKKFPFPRDMLVTRWADYVKGFLIGHFLMDPI